MADLFLSYAREDRECAETLARALAERGWSVWWDRKIHVGQSFSAVIERELDRAKCVIVLWSRYSLASDWVQNEAAEAAKRQALVPVRIEDVRPPLEFRRLQTADLLDWRKGLNSPQFAECITSIETLVGDTASKPLPSKPKTQPGTQQPPPQRPPAPPQPAYQPPPQQAAWQQQQQPPRPQPVPSAVSNYMLPSILVTIGCCVPFGVIAIINAADVNSKLQRGDVAGAMKASATAKMWCLIGLGCGILSWIIGGLMFLSGMMQSGY